MEAIQQPDNFRGTEGYQAPELSRGPCWSTAADVFRAGVVMHANGVVTFVSVLIT